MKRHWPFFAAAAIAAALVGAAAGAHAQGSLRVCSDPDYLPYSNRAGEGFENAVAKIVADALHEKLAYRWYDTRGKGGFEQFLAQTLDKGECDVVMSLPYGSREDQTTDPYYVSSYVFVFSKSKGYDITSLDSPVLHRLKIGFESDTPVQDGLQLRDMVVAAKAFDVAGHSGESPRTMLQAVHDGTVDVMITWEPSVGAYLKDYPDLQVVMLPNARDMGPPEQYSFPMSMGVREGDDALTARLNAVIKTHRGELTAALQRHGVRYVGSASGSPDVGVGMQPVADRVPVAAPEPAATPEPAGLRDAKASDCFACHALDHKVVGPAYDEVARRYAGQGGDAVDKLVDKIIGGGSGVWGQVAMTPHPDLGRPKVRTIVEWILGLEPSAPAAHSAAASASRIYRYKTADGKPVTLDFPVFLSGQEGKVTNDVFAGYEQFNAYCNRCHGDDAVGGAYAAPDLRHSLQGGMSYQQFIDTAMVGRESKGMPSWAGFFPPELIRDIYEYVKARSVGLVDPGRPASAQD